MYNALVLISLLPLAGPEAGQHVAAMPRSETMAVVRTVSAVDPGEEVPTLPAKTVPTRVAYTPDAAPQAGPPVGPPALSSNPPSVDSKTTHQSAVTVASTAPPTVAALDSNSVQAWGFLEVPQWNNRNLSAPFQAVLMKLRTEQRDAKGNIVTDADGRPIIVPLREGMMVFKDQVLGHFDDRELIRALGIAEAQLDVAVSERDKTIEIEHAVLAAKVAEAEAGMLQETNRLHDGAISRLEILKAGLAWEQAKAQYRLQDYTLKEVRTKEAVVREKEVEAANIRIELRKLIAPINGMIVRIDKAEGEWFREGDPVLEIMQLDTLRAVCKISAKYTPTMVDGKNATVYVKGSNEEFRGKVVFAHPKIHPGDVFDVYIEVQNRPDGKYWRLQPGHEITAVIHLQ